MIYMKDNFVFADFHKIKIFKITQQLMYGLLLDDFDLAYIRANCSAAEIDELLKKNTENKQSRHMI